MIPLKLQLKNFLSYGSELQTIDFASYPLICLSGKNGHGKSALLDAITWAIWGQARKTLGTSKADQGLVRLGQTQMMVSLDFEFNGDLYRIKREFAITYGKAYAVLEFGIFDDKQKVFVPLTDKTIRTTQEKIIKTLNLDFDSFVNSAFLRQGQANEFSKKSPKDRKEIFARILGLNRYENIRKLAADKAKQAHSAQKNLQHFQEKIEEELKQTPLIQATLKQVHETIKKVDKDLTALEKQEQQFEKKSKEIREKQNKQKLLLYQQEQLFKKEKDEQQKLRTLVNTWRTIHKKQRSLPDYKQLERNKKNLAQQQDKQQKAVQQLLKLKEEYLSKKETLQVLQQKLQEQQTTHLNTQKIERERLLMAQRNSLQQQENVHKQEIDYKKEKTELEQKITTLEKESGAKKGSPEDLKKKEKQFERRKQFYQRCVALGNILKEELNNLDQKNHLVQEDDPSCPLCEQNLSATRRRFLKQKFSKQEHTIKHRLGRMSHIIKNLKQILLGQHKKLETYKKVIELETQKKKLLTNGAQIKKDLEVLIKEHTTITTTLEQQEKALAKAEQEQIKALENNKEYNQLKHELTVIEKQGKALKYNAQEHQKLNEQIRTIEQQIQEYMYVQTELAQQDQRKEGIHGLCIILKTFKKEKVLLEKELQQHAPLAIQEKKLQQEKSALDAQRKQFLQQKEELSHESGKLETEENKLKKLAAEHKAQHKELGKLACTVEDYQTIATATSKNGIQALLIEEAIPEIEHEANRLLSKLTNNQTQIFIESLRDLKKGGTKETLDINISDPAGIRPYELFSGGEAFRIDFALRIALSKLLARRAGTSLQTLIIDEGFGSQDEEGLSNIMDAIHKIQDDFAKVIIVSHLTSMKDQFPVHFMIHKGAGGSSINVIEQG